MQKQFVLVSPVRVLIELTWGRCEQTIVNMVAETEKANGYSQVIASVKSSGNLSGCLCLGLGC